MEYSRGVQNDRADVSLSTHLRYFLVLFIPFYLLILTGTYVFYRFQIVFMFEGMQMRMLNLIEMQKSTMFSIRLPAA